MFENPDVSGLLSFHQWKMPMLIIPGQSDNVTPFMSLFWEQQKKLLSSSKTGVRYQPIIVRYCLSLAAKSPSGDEELRNSNILVLPRQRTLRDYNNFVRQKRGFQGHVVEELQSLTNVVWCTRLCCNIILWNENQLQPSIGQGYWRVDWRSGSWYLAVNFATLDKINEGANHSLVFFIKSCIDTAKI